MFANELVSIDAALDIVSSERRLFQRDIFSPVIEIQCDNVFTPSLEEFINKIKTDFDLHESKLKIDFFDEFFIKGCEEAHGYIMMRFTPCTDEKSVTSPSYLLLQHMGVGLSPDENEIYSCKLFLRPSFVLLDFCDIINAIAEMDNQNLHASLVDIADIARRSLDCVGSSGDIMMFKHALLEIIGSANHTLACIRNPDGGAALYAINALARDALSNIIKLANNAPRIEAKYSGTEDLMHIIGSLAHTSLSSTQDSLDENVEFNTLVDVKKAIDSHLIDISNIRLASGFKSAIEGLKDDPRFNVKTSLISSQIRDAVCGAVNYASSLKYAQMNCAVSAIEKSGLKPTGSHDSFHDIIKKWFESMGCHCSLEVNVDQFRKDSKTSDLAHDLSIEFNDAIHLLLKVLSSQGKNITEAQAQQLDCDCEVAQGIG